ncbi:MAG: hypothetical protein H0X65_04550 [Gemmatimonadetes bacterium]|nr:hypothetical protein [Gemmatimonadota bacterium]
MGKRPDQYNIDPSEGGATDYKTLPQTGRGNSDALDTVAIDKQQLAQSLKNAQGQPYPTAVPAPSQDVKHGKKLTASNQEDGDDEAAEKGEASS